MSYQLHITSTAEHDIMRAVDYIEFTLKNPDAANNLLDIATEQINSLSDLPQKFQLVDDPVLANWGIRFVIINHYLAFYTIDEEKQIVIIIRFLYQKSNWTSILRQGFPLI
ncbi:type II toxin-antitoxin system RelE/ParE family toxin [Roseburia sp. MUC/MUC-530-WT-4D]|mgnify:CR=1 FL=1|uniref:Type II toxin-antitoxin system RelE/ParE family toxin n=1 Tax=Roseburia porci TaxID=2605790 RepID=A0A6L5YSU7_9FIRM|nr:type II toxin-antitoxin system RelE/ParE family toxin [Roseburia porci]MCI5517849.1 type II toxin-antitoxin system RelE/ParE family toxin [Roseburia sp.]MDD6742245.1 type II toxin-antitoxin system RelE/ParE family toxin [Roseburia porci]MST75039.1 type II toxin-antitoxin system RelE/ParE family toxin [Roseburia porci]